MVALGTYMALVSRLGRLGRLATAGDRRTSRRLLRRRSRSRRPMGFIAIEAGWTVTEVGRQPWIIYGVMRTADAVTPMPGLVYPFVVFTLLYCFLGVIVAWLLYRQIIRSPRPDEWTRLYAPPRIVRWLRLAARRHRRGAAGPLAQRLRAPRRGRLRRRRLGPARHRAAPGAAARGDRPRDRADLGGQSRLADPRDRAGVHLLSRRRSRGS